jgi:hypothetical protein
MKYLFGIILCAICSFPTLAKDKIIFTCPIDGSVILWEKVNAVYTQAFAQLGYDFEMQLAPRARSVLSAQTNSSDGDCGRSKAAITVKDHSELMIVNAVIFNGHTSVWSLDKSETLESFHHNLLKKKVLVGVVRGSLSINRYLQDLDVTNIYEVNSTKQGFQMLLAKRLPYLLDFDAQVLYYLNTLNSTQQRPHRIGNLLTIKYYPVLNKRHQRLVIPLAEAINKIINQRGGPISFNDIYDIKNVKIKADSTSLKD